MTPSCGNYTHLVLLCFQLGLCRMRLQLLDDMVGDGSQQRTLCSGFRGLGSVGLCAGAGSMHQPLTGPARQRGCRGQGFKVLVQRAREPCWCMMDPTAAGGGPGSALNPSSRTRLESPDPYVCHPAGSHGGDAREEMFLPTEKRRKAIKFADLTTLERCSETLEAAAQGPVRAECQALVRW